IEAAALLLATPLIARIVRRPRAAVRTTTPARRSVVADVRAGFDVVVASPLLKRIAIAYVLLSVLLFSVQYPFLISASQTFESDAELATAAGFRLVQQVTQRGLSNASWSAFYNVVPADRRAQVLAFNDGIPGQLG